MSSSRQDKKHLIQEGFLEGTEGTLVPQGNKESIKNHTTVGSDAMRETTETEAFCIAVDWML